MEWASESDREAYERDMLLYGNAARRIIQGTAHHIPREKWLRGMLGGKGYIWIDDAPPNHTPSQ